ncbi:MAG: hypothetical protein ABFD60_04355 [Bryobacteraceae bacterium]
MLPERLRQFVAEHTAELPGIGEEVENHLRNVMTMREEQARFAKRPKLLKPAEEPFWQELRAEVERLEGVVDADIAHIGTCAWLRQIRYPLFTILADIKAMRLMQCKYRTSYLAEHGREAGRLERLVDEHFREECADDSQGVLLDA